MGWRLETAIPADDMMTTHFLHATLLPASPATEPFFLLKTISTCLCNPRWPLSLFATSPASVSSRVYWFFCFAIFPNCIFCVQLWQNVCCVFVWKNVLLMYVSCIFCQCSTMKKCMLCICMKEICTCLPLYCTLQYLHLYTTDCHPHPLIALYASFSVIKCYVVKHVSATMQQSQQQHRSAREAHV